MNLKKVVIVVCGLMTQVVLSNQTPAQRVQQVAFDARNQALSSLVAVTFGDSNLYSAKKQWNDSSISQWQHFINVTMPDYVKLLQPNDQLLNAIMMQIQQSNKELIYCIKIIKADSNLVFEAKKTLQNIQVRMQKIQKELSNLLQKGTDINKKYRQKMLGALAIAVEQTAKKAIYDSLEEDWTEL